MYSGLTSKGQIKAENVATVAPKAAKDDAKWIYDFCE